MTKVSATHHEPAPPPDQSNDDLLHQAAVTVERGAPLTAEMAEWTGTVGDGLDRRRSRQAPVSNMP
jgi:hypothetical protein